MVQVTREHKKTLRKFLDLAYGRDYMFDDDLWELQAELAPTEGYWGTGLANVEQGYWEFEQHRQGLLRGAHAGLNAVFNIQRDGDWSDGRKQMVQLIIGQVEEYLSRYLEEQHIEKMRIHTSRYSILCNWEIAQSEYGVPGMLKRRDELFADYLDGEELELGTYFTGLAGELLTHVRNAEEDDKHIRLGLVDLSSYAYAFWHTEQWRYKNGEINDAEVSHEALDLFFNTYEEMNKLPTNNPDFVKGPTTVSEALSAFMRAYKQGVPPVEPTSKYSDMLNGGWPAK